MVFNDLRASVRFKDIPVIILTGEGDLLKHLAELRQFREDGQTLDRQGHGGGAWSIHFLEA